jgi:hypothetical protein
VIGIEFVIQKTRNCQLISSVFQPGIGGIFDRHCKCRSVKGAAHRNMDRGLYRLINFKGSTNRNILSNDGLDWSKKALIIQRNVPKAQNITNINCPDLSFDKLSYQRRGN